MANIDKDLEFAEEVLLNICPSCKEDRHDTLADISSFDQLHCIRAYYRLSQTIGLRYNKAEGVVVLSVPKESVSIDTVLIQNDWLHCCYKDYMYVKKQMKLYKKLVSKTAYFKWDNR